MASAEEMTHSRANSGAYDMRRAIFLTRSAKDSPPAACIPAEERDDLEVGRLRTVDEAGCDKGHLLTVHLTRAQGRPRHDDGAWHELESK